MSVVTTMRDVAEAAGVTVSAVSHILSRDDPRYNDDTRWRVKDLAARLHYRPNRVAQSLAYGRTHSIGVVGHDLATPMTMEKVDVIDRLADERGYHTLLAGRNAEGNPRITEECIEDLIARRVDGLIILTMPYADTTYYRKLLKRKVCFVLIGQVADPEGLPLISVATEDAVYELARHLVSLGHRDIALALGRFTATRPHDRIAGFERALREVGAELRDDRILKDRPMSLEAVYEFTRQQLGRQPRPTAIFYNNDLAAVAGLRAIRELGLEVPRDVSVVGYDDQPVAAFTSPPLTTARQPREELAAAALTMLMDRIDGNTKKTGHVILIPKVILRESTGLASSTRNAAIGKRNGKKETASV